jgi:long-chain acyl-CoA synthetase
MNEKRLTTLTHVIDNLAERGAKPALIVLREDGVQTWSYAELADCVLRLARGLVGRVGRGETVAIFAADRPEWIAACLAAVRAGAAVLPLDVQLAEDVLGHVLADSGARLVFTTADKVERLARADMAGRVVSVLLDADERDARSWRRLFADDVQGRAIAKGSTGVAGGRTPGATAPRDLPEAAPDDGAALFYTSGTTGRPKGVPLTHANLAFQINAILAANLVTAQDRVALPLPLHHVYPFVLGMLTPLALGPPLIIPQTLTGPQIVRALREGNATVMIGVPRLYSAMYDGILARVQAQGRLAAALFGAMLTLSTALRRRTGLHLGRRLFRRLHEQLAPGLRVLACGGAALDAELAWRLEGLGWRLAIGYGLTETAPLLTLNLPPSPKLDSVGRPVPGVELKIDSAVRVEHLEHGLPAGQGEILARGPNVFRGYRNLPEKTKDAFTADGWFRTGDLGQFDATGYLSITGRLKELIVTAGGENIQPEEVERAYAAHPFIGEFALLEYKGRLVGLILPEPGEIRRHGYTEIVPAIRAAVNEVSKTLPSYQRIFDFAVTRDPLPRTRLDKLKRHLLASCFEQAQALEGRPEAAGALAVEKMTPSDQALLENPCAQQVWKWLCERYPEQHLTPDTSPRLDLGVDSLGWIEFALEIQRLTGVELSEEAIGRIETVRDLLKEVQEAPAAQVALAPWDEPEQVLSPEQRRWLEPLGAFTSVLSFTLFIFIRLIMRLLFRLKVDGLDRLPAGQFVLAPNHVSYLDPLVVGAALPWRMVRRTDWGGWTGVMFTNPLMRAFARLAHVLPVESEAGARSSLAFGAAALKSGHNLVWFPEGERSASGALKPFRPGIGMLLHRFPAPVVPVYIQGAFEALPVSRKWPRLRPITVVFGEALDPKELAEHGAGPDAASRITQNLHGAVSALGRQARRGRGLAGS